MSRMRCPRCGTWAEVVGPEGCYVCTAWPSKPGREGRRPPTILPGSVAARQTSRWTTHVLRVLAVLGMTGLVPFVVIGTVRWPPVQRGLAVVGLLTLGIGATLASIQASASRSYKGWSSRQDMPAVKRTPISDPSNPDAATGRSVMSAFAFVSTTILVLVGAGIGLSLVVFVVCAVGMVVMVVR